MYYLVLDLAHQQCTGIEKDGFYVHDFCCNVYRSFLILRNIFLIVIMRSGSLIKGKIKSLVYGKNL